MTKHAVIILFLSTLTSTALAQNPSPEPERRPVRVIVSENASSSNDPSAIKPRPTPIIVGRERIVERANETAARDQGVSSVSTEGRRNDTDRTLSFREIKAKIAEARRQLQSRPVSTSAVGSQYEGIEIVRLVFHDWGTNELDFIVMTKEAFLSTAADKVLTSEKGRSLVVKTIRGNGVNTPVTITDSTGVNHLPILVQYPRVERGRYLETAYYMSSHPGLGTPEVVNAGQVYVRNVLELARERLTGLGIRIEPKVVDIAERLVAVEHVDHWRFRNEPHDSIFRDIYTLYALNEGQTYRYAVSSAGAGGMIQMIPSTYRMVRSHFSQVPLNPDFVEGMRDHANAAQAMLLYKQWTWEDLRRRPAISGALLEGIATQEQLMAAGYNSNPARLAGYITRGGAGWTNLIPRETQIYLRIFKAHEDHVQMTPRQR